MRITHHRRRPEIYLLFLLLLLLFAKPAAANPWGLDIFGLSYHIDRFDSEGRAMNDFNPGIGAHYDLRETKHSLIMLDSGIYYSSGRSLAEFGAIGWQRKWRILRFGPALSVFHSASYNKGHLFAAPLFLFSVRVSPLTFTVLPIPRYKHKNRNAAIGFFTTWNL
jgi:hypothetical protein